MRIKLLFARSMSCVYSDADNKCRHLIFMKSIIPYEIIQ